MATTVQQVDFTIYYVNNGYKYKLPYAFYESYPVFKWDIPEGITQYSYIFQMRSINPVLYSDGVTYRCAYYNSSKIVSSISQHHLLQSMNSELRNGVVSTIDTWLGGVQVRIRIFDADGNQYTSHELITDTETYYDFQTDHQQYRRWGSTNDGYYFCYDDTINEVINKQKVKFLFHSSYDENTQQQLIYTLQISQTPLFKQGKNQDSLVQVNDITDSNMQIKIDALFQLVKSGDTFQKETINALKSNTLYFLRARAFDGYDYSEWSIINAFRMIYNTVPVCHIYSVTYPYITNGNQKTYTDRSNGEIIVEISIDDDDNDYASATLCFSMVTTQEQAESLGCAVNTSTDALIYANEISNTVQKSGLIRCRLKESLIKIPTSKKIGSQHLFVTWYTDKQIKNTKKDSVYLYMAGNDGISSAKIATFGKFEIDNTKLNGDEVSLPAQNFWLRGKTNWGYWFPYLPMGMLRQLIVRNGNINTSTNDNDQVGGHDYNWYTAWKTYQDQEKKTWISRVTQGESFVIKDYYKYPQSGESTCGYKESTISAGNKFVSFCMKCDTLQILETIVIKDDGTYADSIKSAFINRYAVDLYKGQYFTLGFKCPECNTIYPIEWRYHDHLTYSGFMKYFKKCYSYWHGYNTDSKVINDEALILGLQVYREGEQIDSEKIKYAQQYYDSSTSSVIDKIKQTDALNDSKDIIGKAMIGDDTWMMYPNDKLKKLQVRPQIDSYFRITPPKSQFYTYARYFDGAQLNFDVKKDYMDPEKTQSSSKQSDTDKDKDMQALLNQKPWNYTHLLSYHYTAGKDLGDNKAFEDVCFQSKGDVSSKNYTSENNNNVVNTSIIINKFSCGLYLTFPLMIYRYNQDYKVIINNKQMVFNIMNNNNCALCTVINNKKYPIYYYIKDNQTKYLYCAFYNDKNTWMIGNLYYSQIVNDNFDYYCNKQVQLPDFSFDWNNKNGKSINIKISVNNELKRKNDMFKAVVNDQIIYQGSILQDYDNDIFKCLFPYNNSNYKTNSYASDIINFLSKIFNKYFNTTNSNDDIFPEYSSKSSTEKYKIFHNKVDVLSETLFINLYGNFSPEYKKFQLKSCYGNCYDLFNLVPFITYQNYRGFLGKIGGQNIKVNGLSDGKTYYYTQRNYKTPTYGAQESPIDNVIQSSIYTLSNASSGQPMFTCYKDEVDQNGYHFKYTEEDFKKTGKIYVRRYHIQQCNPFSNKSFGYRNWIVVPIPGKPGRYYKKKVLNTRGAPAISHMIHVQIGEKVVLQEGFFAPDEYGNPKTCLSHKAPEAKDNQSIETDIDKITYELIDYGQKDNGWYSKIVRTTCVVFDYVDAEEAMTKNIVDMEQNLNPFNHHCPIHINGGAFNIDINKINRYGLYVMGGYELNNDQKKIDNDGQDYEKQFSSLAGYVVNDNGDKCAYYQKYTQLMPNNWRPKLINSVLVTESSCGSNMTFYKQIDGSSSSTKIGTYDRYKKAWANKISIPSDAGVLSQITIEQFNPALKSLFKIYEKTGYESKNRIQYQYQVDQDGYYKGKYIPLNSRVVHKLYEQNEITFRMTSKIKRQRQIISDKTFLDVDDTYDKVQYIDYRLLGFNTLLECVYFSGYPRSQHESYATRPQPPYAYDRQWRIGGYNIVRQDYNIFFDQQSVYGSDWSFYYFQDEFNTYSRLHWSQCQGENEYACIYAQQVTGGLTEQSIGDLISVKTNSSLWIEKKQAWCIPYNYDMSDMVDIVNSGLQDGLYYKFIMKKFTIKYDINTNQEYYSNAQNVMTSRRFLVSKSSISPATIVSTDYDPWTKQLTIQFRFDDSLGRTYDITGIQYADKAYDQESTVWYPSDPTSLIGNLTGDLYDLQSNKYGDSVVFKNFIKTYKLTVNISLFSIQSSDSLRIRLLSDLSIDRDELTIPQFNIKMWANEFLKPVEQRIMSIQGYSNRWVWVDEVDDVEGTTGGYWKYVSESEAVPILGSIQQNEQKLITMDNEFYDWYYRISEFQYPDLDCFQQFLSYDDERTWYEFYYNFIFNTYLIYNNQDYQNTYQTSYEKFYKKHSEYSKYYIIKCWLSENNLTSDYKSFYQNHRLTFLSNYRKNYATISKFNKFFEQHKIQGYTEARQQYALNHESSYDDYYNIDTSSSSSSSTVKRVFDDKSVMNFIENTGVQNSFIVTYSENVFYADTRFEQRALIMNKKYGVITEGLFEKEYKNIDKDVGTDSEKIYSVKYNEWLNKTSILDKNKTNDEAWNNLSDKYQLFLAEMSGTNKDITIVSDISKYKSKSIDDVSVEIFDSEYNINNYGKSLAKTAFLKSPSSTGFSYSQRYQSVNETLSSLYDELAQCKSKKNHLQTDFRKKLIKQGYFCNGFQDNQPYNSNGDTNICFRWRVETEAYQGTVDSNTIYDEDGVATVYGYQPRFNMYIRFQLDFYDTFDSQQNEKPLRDIFYIQNGKSSYSRILASIKDFQEAAKTNPLVTPTAQSTLDIPVSIEDTLLVDKTTDNYTYSAYNINDKQFTAQFGLARGLLPGRLNTDKIPSEFQKCWGTDKNGLQIDPYKSAYYWRVAPYNIVEVPFFDTMIGYILLDNPSTQTKININADISKNIFNKYIDGNVYERVAILYNLYHSSEITNGTIENLQDPLLYIAVNKLQQPKWTLNVNSIIYDSNNVAYNNSWINSNMLNRGQVQFVTDRPRSITVTLEEEQIQSSSSQEQKYKYYNLILNDLSMNIEMQMIRLDVTENITKVNNNTYYVYKGILNNESIFLYCAKYNNLTCWFIGRKFSSIQTDNGNWYYCVENVILDDTNTLSDEQDYFQFPDLQNITGWYKKGYKDNSQNNQLYISIIRNTNIIKDNESTSSSNQQTTSSSSQEDDIQNRIDYTKGEINWISDNINNYDTNWYPYTNIRKKPFVIFYEKEYLLFSYKTLKIMSAKTKSGIIKTYDVNVITLSRGFTNNIFGQEGMVLLNYTDQELSEIIPNAISFYNPTLVKLENTWRMYFNVKFFNENATTDEDCFYSKIYKADTNDFESWNDIKQVNLFKNKTYQMNDCLQPNVVINYTLNPDTQNEYIAEFYMYVISLSTYDNIYTIKELYSQDGINFYFEQELYQITDGLYNFHSPFVFNYNNHKKLYFTIESNHDINNNYSELILSLDSNSDGSWRTEIYDDNSTRFMIEKCNGYENIPFNGANFGTDSHFSNPCIILDADGGCQTPRLYYNTYDVPYLWRILQYQDSQGEEIDSDELQEDNTKSLVMAKGLIELTIHTEYLEEYEWVKESIANIVKTEQGVRQYDNTKGQWWYEYDNNKKYIDLVQYASSVNDIVIDNQTKEKTITWHNMQSPFNENIIHNGNSDCYYPVSQEGIYIKFNWLSSYMNCYAVKIKTGSVNKIKECLSQGEWIGFDNVEDTQATIYPTLLTDLSYDITNYSCIIFIQENDLTDDYKSWKQQSNINEDNENIALQFIIQKKQYAQYIWWSRKGQGIYKYIGYTSLKDYSWLNNYDEYQQSSSSSE